MKLLLSILLLTSSIATATRYKSDAEFFKELIYADTMEEMHRFIDALTFDELIKILELAKQKPIVPYSSLDIKLQLFLLRLEKLPWWDELDDEDDMDTSYLLYELHAAAYEHAWELVQKMPNADCYRAVLMKQMRPEEYEQLLDEESVAHLFVD